ncbi:hypothetical protein ACOMHN_055242 [Nucella lapillus]
MVSGSSGPANCETQLIELADELTSNMASGQRTDILVLDFAKAFDKVNHSLLSHKLHRYGVRGKINKWTANFLAKRRQTVVVQTSSTSSQEFRRDLSWDHFSFWSS